MQLFSFDQTVNVMKWKEYHSYILESPIVLYFKANGLLTPGLQCDLSIALRYTYVYETVYRNISHKALITSEENKKAALRCSRVKIQESHYGAMEWKPARRCYAADKDHVVLAAGSRNPPGNRDMSISATAIAKRVVGCMAGHPRGTASHRLSRYWVLVGKMSFSTPWAFRGRISSTRFFSQWRFSEASGRFKTSKTEWGLQPGL